LSERIDTARSLEKDFRLLAHGFGLLTPLVREKFLKASDVWGLVAEDAEDIRDMIAAEQDNAPSIPWEQLKAELGLCPTQ